MAQNPKDHENLIATIQRHVANRQYRLTVHAEREREADRIMIHEIEEALRSSQCQVVENYPDDPRGASCLVLGLTEQDAPIHVVCGVAETEMLIMITVYRPHPDLWVDWVVRRGSDKD